ncbi:hypothetical protein [Aquibacillus kalidii]|uniref:hypothetical protein n=1 Tax=Aquibacillus kalidii TaxID=2762597 RepID=UPI0016456649|nr:hypothetical protein [Aquibacillus kalidii]
MSRYHSVCKRHVGRAVKITTVDGRVHRGIIRNVNNTHVFLEGVPARNLGGYGYGYYRRPYGYRPGFGWGVALGSIATLALLPFFWW